MASNRGNRVRGIMGNCFFKALYVLLVLPCKLGYGIVRSTFVPLLQTLKFMLYFSWYFVNFSWRYFLSWLELFRLFKAFQAGYDPERNTFTAPEPDVKRFTNAVARSHRSWHPYEVHLKTPMLRFLRADWFDTYESLPRAVFPRDWPRLCLPSPGTRDNFNVPLYNRSWQIEIPGRIHHMPWEDDWPNLLVFIIKLTWKTLSRHLEFGNGAKLEITYSAPDEMFVDLDRPDHLQPFIRTIRFNIMLPVRNVDVDMPRYFRIEFRVETPEELGDDFDRVYRVVVVHPELYTLSATDRLPKLYNWSGIEMPTTLRDLLRKMSSLTRPRSIPQKSPAGPQTLSKRKLSPELMSLIIGYVVDSTDSIVVCPREAYLKYVFNEANHDRPSNMPFTSNIRNWLLVSSDITEEVYFQIGLKRTFKFFSFGHLALGLASLSRKQKEVLRDITLHWSFESYNIIGQPSTEYLLQDRLIEWGQMDFRAEIPFSDDQTRLNVSPIIEMLGDLPYLRHLHLIMHEGTVNKQISETGLHSARAQHWSIERFGHISAFVALRQVLSERKRLRTLDNNPGFPVLKITTDLYTAPHGFGPWDVMDMLDYVNAHLNGHATREEEVAWKFSDVDKTGVCEATTLSDKVPDDDDDEQEIVEDDALENGDDGPWGAIDDDAPENDGGDA